MWQTKQEQGEEIGGEQRFLPPVIQKRDSGVDVISIMEESNMIFSNTRVLAPIL